MRAAVKIMGLGKPSTSTKPIIVADLGCGDGEFLLGMIAHITSPTSQARGIGVDYDAQLIATAEQKTVQTDLKMEWLIYDFNLDQEDLASQLLGKGATHLFAYLIPKQLALKTVRAILERLLHAGVVVCCYKFHPGYLTPSRRDEVMNLEVYKKLEGEVRAEM